MSLPALVFASQQQFIANSSSETSLPSQPIQSETSSLAEEVFSSSSVEVGIETASGILGETVGEATINGETIPLTNESVTTRHIDNNNNSVDVDISVHNDDSSNSISSSSSTEIHIESHGSSDSETNSTRGSPRR
ncbi:MAG: hypothetical protein ABIR46_04175 [Candidatus Saccharimonadales bacterium]